MTDLLLDAVSEHALMTADVSLDSFILNVVRSGIPDFDIAGSIVSGDVNRTIEGASTLPITVHDPERILLRSRALHNGDGQLRTIDLQLDGLWWRLVKVRKSLDDLVLTFEEREVALLREHHGPRKASRKKVKRAEFVLSLVRLVKSHPIAVHIPELHEKQPIAKPKPDKASRDRRRERGFPDGVKLKAFNSTHNLNKTQLDNATIVLNTCETHSAGEKATLAALEACYVEAPNFNNPIGGDGTSSGILQVTAPTARGAHIKDRRDIEEVVTYFLLHGFFGNGGAIKVARDHSEYSAGQVAQAVQGSAVPARYDQARSRARAMLDEWGGATTTVTTPTYKKYEFKIDKKESYWTGIQRLAAEVNRRAFIVSGVFYWISEEDLFKSRARMTVSEDDPGVNIDFDHDTGRKVATATIGCRVDRWEAPPGSVVIVKDTGPADGRWLVMSIRRSIFSADATISLKRPMAEKAEPATEPGTDRTTTSGGTIAVRGGARGIVEAAVRIAQDVGGDDVYVGSALRPGSVTTSGNVSDHSQNNSSRAARDIGVQGIDLIIGPPSPRLDEACVAIGAAFGRTYRKGQVVDADTFEWNGYRIQIIWRTPKYGGHMGHIHVGARSIGSNLKLPTIHIHW